MFRKSLNSKQVFWGKWLVLAFLVGIVAGVAATIFQFAVQFFQFLAISEIAGIPADEAAGEHTIFYTAKNQFRIWLVIPIMTLGGLTTGLIVYRFAPEAQGHGTDGAIDAFHNKRGIIPFRIPFVKAIASAITLGTGGSAGKEGPIAQIAAGLGSYIAQRLKLSTHDRRVLLAIGMGAGIGAIFRAPLAGAIFAGEILYRDADIESEAIIPAAIASTIAYSVFQLSLPIELRFTPLFGDALQHEVGSVLELVPYTILAILLVGFSILYIKTFYLTQSLFQKIRIWPHLKPAIGALAAATMVVSVFFWLGQNRYAMAPMGGGYGFLQTVFDKSTTEIGILFLFVVALAKIMTTSLTIGSGGSGGVFGPSIVIGGSIGAGVGKACAQWIPVFLAVTQVLLPLSGWQAFLLDAPTRPFQRY